MDRLSSFWNLRNNCIDCIRKSLQARFSSIESQCDAIGQAVCAKIENGEIPPTKAIEDILQYVRCKSKQDKTSKTKQEVNRHHCWLLLHMGLGICFRGRHCLTREQPRKILYELLQFNRGVEFGIFLQDVFEHEGNLSERTAYLLYVCAGFTIKFTDYIFICPHREVWRELLRGNSCQYLDLPISQSTLPPDVDVNRTHLRPSPLLLAIVNLKPAAALLLLRHGATANGHPIDYILRMFGSVNTFVTSSSQGDLLRRNMGILTECFVYCLRTVKHLTLLFEPVTVVDIPRRDVYYVKHQVKSFIPPFYTRPFELQHLCRCAIRDRLIDNGMVPHGIAELGLPEHLQNYVNLLS